MEYLRVEDVSSYMKISVATVWLYTKQHKITAIKLSPRVTVWAKSDLDAFVVSCITAGA